MKKTVTLLFTLCALLFSEECDTIKNSSHPAANASFQLRIGDDVTQLAAIASVENGIMYANQWATGDAVVIFDVTGELNLGTDGVKKLSTIVRTGSNSEYNLPMKKVGDTLFFVVC